jgi:hypothetical protein
MRNPVYHIKQGLHLYVSVNYLGVIHAVIQDSN